MATVILPVQHVHFGNPSWTNAPRNQTPTFKSYGNAEWEAMKATITHLYSVERQPLAEVRRQLRQLGFLVKYVFSSPFHGRVLVVFASQEA